MANINISIENSLCPTIFEYRRNDKIPQVRIVWIESLVKLIKAHGNLAKELSGEWP